MFKIWKICHKKFKKIKKIDLKIKVFRFQKMDRNRGRREGFGGDVENVSNPKLSQIEIGRMSNSEINTAESNLEQIYDSMTQITFTHTRLQYMNREQMELYCAACTITNANDDGIGSVNDPSMGCTDIKIACKTCNQVYSDCPGHPGIIKLIRPIMNPDINVVRMVSHLLSSVCKYCNRLYDRTPVKTGESGLARIKAHSVKSSATGFRCDGTYSYINSNGVVENVRCGASSKYKIGPKEKGTSKKSSQYKIFENGDEMDNERIYEILKNIPAEDKITLGCSKNTNFEAAIMWGIPVPPKNIRPDTMVKGILKRDQLTECYQKIAKLVITQKNLHGKDENKKFKDLQDEIQWTYAKLLNNSDGALKVERSDMPIKDLRKRIAGKEELIRRHAMGKRNDYAGRTVLNPNKVLEFGQLSKPKRYASVLTVNTKLTKYNWKEMLKMYDEGKVVAIELNYSSARNSRIKITPENREYNRKRLGLGCIVHRHSINGDVLYFLRFPSLYKYADMSHNEIQTPNEVIGVHSSVTTAANADFDGDEGNLGQHQGPFVRAEGYFLAHVTKNIMSNNIERPLMGLVFNCPAAFYMLLLFYVIFNHDEWDNAISYLKGDEITKKRLDSLPRRLKRYGVKEYSGAALFSALLPEDFNYNAGKFEESGGKIKQLPLEIREGVLRSGVITKDHIGPVACSIQHFMHKEYHPDIVTRFFTEGQFIADWYLEKRGLSMCYSDCYPSEDVTKKINEITSDGVKAAEKLIASLPPEDIQMSAAMRQHRENEMIIIMQNPTNKGNKIAIDALPKWNNLSISCMSGSKGSGKNISQITSLLGPQLSKGKIQEKTVSGGRRSTCWHSFGDKSLGSMGFVASNFNKGLEPEEFYFHCQATRTTLMDTGVNTGRIGDASHKLNKVLEDVHRGYNNSITNGINIFQYVHDDGYKCEELIPVNTKIGSIISVGDFGNIAQKLNSRNGYDRTYCIENGKYTQRYRHLKN